MLHSVISSVPSSVCAFPHPHPHPSTYLLTNLPTPPASHHFASHSPQHRTPNPHPRASLCFAVLRFSHLHRLHHQRIQQPPTQPATGNLPPAPCFIHTTLQPPPTNQPTDRPTNRPTDRLLRPLTAPSHSISHASLAYPSPGRKEDPALAPLQPPPPPSPAPGATWRGVSLAGRQTAGLGSGV